MSARWIPGNIFQRPLQFPDKMGYIIPPESSESSAGSCTKDQRESSTRHPIQMPKPTHLAHFDTRSSGPSPCQTVFSKWIFNRIS